MGAGLARDSGVSGAEYLDCQAAIAGSAAWNGVADKTRAEFGATDGKEVITLTPEEAATFNAASKPVVEKVIAEADAAGLDASAFVAALKE